MVTGIEEALSAAEVLAKVIEVGKICADYIEKWKAFGKDVDKIHDDFSHEKHQMESLQRVLMDKEKLGFDRPLFEMMDSEMQRLVKKRLLRILQPLQDFQKIEERYGLSGGEFENTDTTVLLNSVLASHALHTGLSALQGRARLLQTTTKWTNKARWTFGGREDAKRLVESMREELERIKENIDEQFWNMASTVPSQQGNISARLDRLETLGHDNDMTTLALHSSMRVRKFVLQLQVAPTISRQPFPTFLTLDSSLVQVSMNIHSGRHEGAVFSMKGRLDAFVEFRTYKDNPMEVEAAMQSLCMMLAEPKEDSFRLPKPCGLFHDAAKSRFGLVFPVDSIGAANLGSVWTLDRLISTKDKKKLPDSFAGPVLEDRFRLALAIATAIGKFHSVSWFYQGMQAQNICFGDGPAGRFSIDRPFLFGFAKTRSFDALSWENPDLVANAYRHPERWEPKPKSRHSSLHDLYSLGVIMLQIGLWKSMAALLSRSGPSHEFDISTWTPSDVQAELKHWAERRLATQMGSVYQQITIALLDARPHNSTGNTWITLPAKERLLRVIGALQEMCVGICPILEGPEVANEP